MIYFYIKKNINNETTISLEKWFILKFWFSFVPLLMCENWIF